jgi:glycosyltransferase involved in cell wall biosynthesis
MKVVACTPTKNRRWTWEWSKWCMNSQIRKPDAWIVVDNSSCPAYDWSVARDHPGVVYERIHGDRSIGWLRNRCIEIALEQNADILVFWDDDDYYPPTRISTGLAALEANPDADIAGSSKMYMLLVKENVFMATGPFGSTHATAATHTIRRRYFETHRFSSEDVRGEERNFTMQWTAKVVQVPAEETIVVMGHQRNTVNKSDVLANPVRYSATVLNADNGKMAFRARWPVPWDLWKSTFFGATYALPPENNPSEEVQTVTIPTLRIEETAVSAEHRA